MNLGARGSGGATVQGQSLGGIGLFANQRKLRVGFGLAVGAYLTFFYFTARGSSVEALGCALLMVLVAFLPAYLWCAGKVHGLPIFPILALNFIPTYALPVQTASKVLKDYSPSEQAEGLLCVIGYLLLITLVWWQLTNASSRPMRTCIRFDESKSASWMVWILFAYLILLVAGQGLSPGVYALIRGVLGNTSALALFVLSYQIGQNRCSDAVKYLTVTLALALILVEAAGLILASAIVKLSIIGVGYTLGRGVVPWKSMVALLGLLWVLHAGKSDMREEYWRDGMMGATKVGIVEYPQLFIRWMELGIKNITPDDAAKKDRQTAAERGSLLNVFLKIKSMTPGKVPYLEGLTYQDIPKLLVPRFLSSEKGFSHVGNMWLAYLYEFTSLEGLFRVSIQFDLMMEAYANYGYIGIAGMALGLGIFLSWVTRLSTAVPLFSLRFLFAILVLNTLLGTNNTLGVFVTTLWQGTIALLALAFVLMKKLPNPLYAKPEASQKMGDGRSDIGGQKTKAGGQMVEVGGQQAVISGHPSSISENPSTVQQKHERPKRFVYGTKSKK